MTSSIFSRDHKRLVERIKEARKNIGLEQQDVAKMLRKTQSYVSKVESGQRRIDIIQLKEFARIYKKDLSFFLN